MQIVQEVLDSNTPADSLTTSGKVFPTETTTDCVSIGETLVNVRHAQTQVIMKPGMTHEGRQIDYHACYKHHTCNCEFVFRNSNGVYRGVSCWCAM